MKNKKKVLIGLVTILLFIPMFLHNKQVHASAMDEAMSPEAGERFTKE